MRGIDPTIVVHNIVTIPDAKLVKQKLRKMHPCIALLVKEELAARALFARETCLLLAERAEKDNQVSSLFLDL